jgi:seryl-tRNA synthetase
LTADYDMDDFNRGLVEHGLIVPSSVKGAYGRGAVFEDIVQRFDALVRRETKDDGAQEMMFPPIVPRTLIEKLGYLDNFPQLAGSIHSFRGSDAQAREIAQRARDGERCEDLLSPTDVMLAPAACYPVYPCFSG